MLKDTVKKRLGYMVKNEREHLRLSQSALAEQAGVSIRTISDIETCNGNPELATLIPLAQYLKISLDAIIHEAPLVQKFLNKWTIFLFCSILFSSNQKEH